VDFTKRANGAVLDPGENLLHRSVGIPGHKVRGNALFAGGVDHQPGFLQAIGKGLMHDHMLALLHGGDADDAVQMVRCHDLDRVQVLFFVQQFAKVCIRRAAGECAAPTLSGIAGLNNVFCDLPPSWNNPLGVPVRLPQSAANGLEKGIS
jgi:hypothetical protein